MLKRKERRVKNNGEFQTPASTDMKVLQSPLSTQASHPGPRKIDAMSQIAAMLTPRRKHTTTVSIALGEAVRVSATASAWTRILAHRLRIFPGHLSMSIWPLLVFHLHAKANCLNGRYSTTILGLTLPKNTNTENGEALVSGRCSKAFSFPFSFHRLFSSFFKPFLYGFSSTAHILEILLAHIFNVPPILFLPFIS